LQWSKTPMAMSSCFPVGEATHMTPNPIVKEAWDKKGMRALVVAAPP